MYVAWLAGWAVGSVDEKNRTRSRVCDVSPVSASRQAKAAGLDSLTDVSRATGVSWQTLDNWHKHKPELFAIVLLGCREKIKEALIEEKH